MKKFWKRLSGRSTDQEWWAESVHWHVNHPLNADPVESTRESNRRYREAKARLTPEDFNKWQTVIKEGSDRRIQRMKEAKARLTPEQFEKWLEEEEQPFPLDVEELYKAAEEKRQKRLEQQMADEARGKAAEEEGKRLALQDQPRLDAKIKQWAAGISREEVKRWVSEDLARAPAEDIIKEFDYTIREYHPMQLIMMWVAGTDPTFDWSVNTHGGRLAMEASCSSPLLSAAGDEEDVDILSVEFKRECYNDIYVVKGRLRKMKELYMQVFKEMDLMEGKTTVEQRALGVDDRGEVGGREVRTAFLNKLEALEPELKALNLDVGIDFFIFEERDEEGQMLVKGRGYLERSIWGAFNDMVRSELGGRYDPSERGWVIEIEKHARDRKDQKLRE